MSDSNFKTPHELQERLGNRLKRLRLARNLDQRETAEKAGVSEKALRNLEAGKGSNVGTLLRTLKALDYLEGIEILLPDVAVDPIALLRKSDSPQRVRRPHKSKKAQQ